MSREARKQVGSESLMDGLYAAKAARRKRLAKLPIHKKIEIVVQLQKLAAPLLKEQGRRAVWKIGLSTKIGAMKD